jgi:AmiR/NasT family two-component response regulator
MAAPLQTIAIVDDEQGILNVLRAVALKLGYACVGTATTGAEAVDLVRRTRPNIVLIDFHLPDTDGLDVTRQIVALGSTAVVLMTADSDPAIARSAMDLGASGYMLKPFETTQISAILETAWHRFQTIVSLQNQARSLNEALELRKLNEKAKGILMEQQGFSEEEAHHWLLKMSQDQGIPLKDVCRSVIQVRMVLGKKHKRVA